MDSKLLYEISKILLKLERKPLFQYFASEQKYAPINMNGLFLSSLQQRVFLNSISSKEEVKNSLVDFLNRCKKIGSITRVEKRSIHYLKKYVNRKFDDLNILDIESWKTEWSQTYQQLSVQLAKRRKNIPEMRLVDDTLPMCEEDMLRMSTKIKQSLNPEQQSLLIDLITTLENGTPLSFGEFSFDLHDLKNETLYAIKTYLSTIKDKTVEEILIGND